MSKERTTCEVSAMSHLCDEAQHVHLVATLIEQTVSPLGRSVGRGDAHSALFTGCLRFPIALRYEAFPGRLTPMSRQ